MKISILQWNVLYLEKADNILKLIKFVDADVVCLQELTQHSEVNPHRDIPAEIGSLGYHCYYKAPEKDSTLTLGNGIFSKFPLSNLRQVYLIHADPSNKDFPQFDRGYIEARLNLPNTTLTLGTAHLSYSPHFTFFPAKQAEAEKFLDTISPNRQRFIVTGDFNATPDSNLIQELDNILVHAGPDYSEPTWTTKPFEMHDFKADTLDWRLDYVFTTPDVKLVSSKIVETDFSDHLPVLVEVEV